MRSTRTKMNSLILKCKCLKQNSCRQMSTYSEVYLSRIVQPEYVIQHIIASLWCWYQMEHLAELEGVLFAGELEVAADEDEHGGVDA